MMRIVFVKVEKFALRCIRNQKSVFVQSNVTKSIACSVFSCPLTSCVSTGPSPRN